MSALAVTVGLGACFDFDATMAGGPLVDGGLDAVADVSVDGATVDRSVPGEASTDGGSGDAGDAGDAGADATDGSPTDAPTLPEGSTTFSCASIEPPEAGPFFCDDFDEHALPGSWQSWGEMLGTMVETDASAVSPPNSVVETTMPLSSGQVVNVALRTPLAVPTPPATLTFAFAVQPVQIDTTANAATVLGSIDFLDSGGYRYTVGLAINVASGLPALALGEQSGLANGMNYPDGAPPTFTNHPFDPAKPLVMKTWSDVVIELDWKASGLTGRVTIDGVDELDVTLTMTLVPTSLQIGIGTSFVTEYEGGLSPVWEIRYDNVLFTTK
jgi:hypothetical protein